MTIPGEILKQLRNAFLEAFNRSDLTMLIREELNVSFEDVVRPGNFRQQVHDLLDWAQRRGRLEELAQAACAAVPRNTALQEACAALRSYLETTTDESAPGESTGDQPTDARNDDGDTSRQQPLESRWPSLGVLGLVVGILGAVLTAMAWMWPKPPDEPPPPPSESPIYYLRVQVLDPEGNPVQGSTIRASHGNEPQRLAGDWWEVEFATAKLPLDRKVTLWAEHPDWKTGKQEIVLAKDPNSSLEIRLQTPSKPESRLGGLAFGGDGRVIAGARVTVRSHAGGEARTDRNGRFELTVEAKPGQRVRLHVEHPDFQPTDPFCHTGRSDCPVPMQPQ